MKIVKVQRPLRKIDKFRAFAKELKNDAEKSVEIETFTDVHSFGKVLKSMGAKPHWRKQIKGGWLVWADF